MTCQFCNNPDIEQRTVYKDSLVWVFPTYIPIVPGHMLLTPARHVAKISDLTEEEFQAIFHMLPKVRKALEQAFGATGFNHAWNEGQLAGQSVPHFHLHILPRKEGDTGILQYDPRKFLYSTGEREISPDEELKKVCELVKKHLAVDTSK